MPVPLLITRVSFNVNDEDKEGPPLLVTLKCRDRKGDRVNLIVEGTQPALWVDLDPRGFDLPDYATFKDEAEYNSLEGTPLWKINVVYPHQRNRVARMFPRSYSDDVPYEQAVRWMYGWRSTIEVDEKHLKGTIRPIHIQESKVDPGEFTIKCFTFDIETWDEGAFIGPDKATNRVVSIAIHDSETDMYEVGTTAKGTSARIVKKMLTEQENLHRLVDHDVDIPPLRAEQIIVKVITAGDEALPEFEDEESEAALLWWFKRRLERYDPDVVIGHNLKGFDLPYLRRRCRIKNKEITNWKSENRRDSKLRKKFPWINWKDYAPFCTMIAYSEQIAGAPVAAGMGSLHWMSGRELGYGKVPRTEIHKMFYDDPNLLAMYNVWDIVLPVRVIESMDLIGFYAYKTAFHDSPMDHSSSNMFLIESMLGHRLYPQGIVMPSVKLVREKIGDQRIESGGFVSDARTGIWNKAFELDNSKEYPSAIITANLCPTTRIRETKDSYPFPITTTPNGTVYRRDKIGIMPEILREMALGRDEVRSEMLNHPKGSSQWMLLNRKQRVMKENMNSFYGVLGSGATSKTKGRPFRLADPQIASDITKIAQEHEHWNKAWIEKASLWFHAELGVIPKEEEGASEMRFEVLYQDTDSCKCCIVGLEQIEDEQRPLENAEVYSVANMLSIQLNETFHDFCKQTLGVPRNEFFAIKPEEVYLRYFQWGAKKRYAYMNLDGELEFKGVEMKRSSVAPIVKIVQYKIFNAILQGEDKQGIVRTVKEANDDMLDSELTADIEFGRPNGLNSDNPSTQQWKAAMWSNQNLNTNFEIGTKPVLFFASSTPGRKPAGGVVALPYGEDPHDWKIAVDRQESIRRFFQDSASMKAILGAVGVKWEEAVSGVMRADFGGFFE